MNPTEVELLMRQVAALKGSGDAWERLVDAYEKVVESLREENAELRRLLRIEWDRRHEMSSPPDGPANP